MKKYLLLSAFFLAAAAGFSSTSTITNSGYEFTPAALTIAMGDDVNFVLEAMHNAREVSQATWNANGNTALPGGFTVPYGGGNVAASFLTTGIHYYVCAPHAALGMKGTISVINTTGITENLLKEGISVFPNPSYGKFQLKVNNPQVLKPFNLGIYDVLGNRVYTKSELLQADIINVEISDLPRGTYLIRFDEGEESYCRKIIIR